MLHAGDQGPSGPSEAPYSEREGGAVRPQDRLYPVEVRHGMGPRGSNQEGVRDLAALRTPSIQCDRSGFHQGRDAGGPHHVIVWFSLLDIGRQGDPR